MNSADYAKLSSEQLCMLWLKFIGAKGFTHSDIETDCRVWWQDYGTYRLGSTYKRAMQRLMEHNKLGPIKTKQVRQDGQIWTRYSFLRKNMADYRKLGSISHSDTGLTESFYRTEED